MTIYRGVQIIDIADLSGNGLLTKHAGQLVGRSLVPDIGIDIRSPTGLAGDIVLKPSRGEILLAELDGANLNSTADQMLSLIRQVPRYRITTIEVRNASIAPTTAAGGFYTAPSKGGYALVASSQVYSSLTDAGLSLVLSPAASRWLTGPAIYLSLTTAQGAACTADVRVWGLWDY